MPTLPSGRTLGLASVVNYAQLVWREQTHIINRAALELVQRPEHLYEILVVVEKTADGRDLPLGLTVRGLLDGSGDVDPADRAAYADWLQQPQVLARLQQDLDELHAALAQTRFRLPANVREVFPEEHAAQALLDLTRTTMADAESAKAAQPQPDRDPTGAGE